MHQPQFNNQGAASAEQVQAAIDAGLPVIDGQQAVGIAGAGGVTWYRLADGSDVIQDADGNPAQWPA